MLNNWIGKLVIATCILSLSGCATQSNKAKCGVGKGAGCKSVTEVNSLVSSGELEKSNEELNNSKPKRRTLMLTENTLLTDNPELLGSKSVNTIRRSPEQTARVWINGFNDEMGDYVQETYIHTVIEEGRWVNVK